MNRPPPQTLTALPAGPSASKASPRIPRVEAHATTMTRTVLHADDSGAVRRWIADQLAGMGLKVISVADGDAALQYLRGAACDLLLTDLEMPNLDGLALLAAARELPSHRFLPVLVLSSRQPAEIAPVRRQGVAGWLVKPVEGERLRRWIRRALPE